MTDTRRLRKGYVTLAMAVPEEMATIIRVQAVLAHKSIGDYMVSLVPQVDRFGGVRAIRENAIRPPRKTLPELLEGTEDVHFGEGGEMTLKAPAKASRKRQEPSDGTGTHWTTERLQEALSAAGTGSQSRLAQHIGKSSAAVRSWLKTGRVPSEWWSVLDAFFAEQA